MHNSTRTSILLGAAMVLLGCRGGQLPEVLDVREVATSHSKPEITSVLGLGAGVVPRQGRLRAARRDASAVIGELLLIEGSGFGKQPTVNIGGRAAAVVARVDGGGLVSRVPWGIDPGQVEIEVSNAAGRHVRAFPIRRVGLVVTGRSLVPLSIAADGAVAAEQPLPMPGAEHLAISSDGAAAYVAGVGDGPRLRILDLTASPPAVAEEHPLQGSKVVDVCAAEQSPLALVVTDTHLHFFETSDAIRPAHYHPVPLPGQLRQQKVLAAALGGQGHLLALLLAEANQVVVLDVSDPARPRAPVTLEVLASPLSLLQDLRFSADEGSLWVASGDGARSIAGGLQPVRVSLIQVQRGEQGLPALSIHKTWPLGEREGPLQMAVARGEPIPPGTVIRPEPSPSAVYLAVVSSEWLKPGSKPKSLAGATLRTAIGRGTDRIAAPAMVTSVDVVGKTQILLGLGFQQNTGERLRRVVASRRAWEEEPIKVVGLDEVESAGTPPSAGEIRGQP